MYRDWCNDLDSQSISMSVKNEELNIRNYVKFK